MLKLPKSEFTVPFNGKFKLADMPTSPTVNLGKKTLQGTTQSPE